MSHCHNLADWQCEDSKERIGRQANESFELRFAAAFFSDSESKLCVSSESPEKTPANIAQNSVVRSPPKPNSKHIKYMKVNCRQKIFFRNPTLLKHKWLNFGCEKKGSVCTQKTPTCGCKLAFYAIFALSESYSALSSAAGAAVGKFPCCINGSAVSSIFS